MSICTNFVYKAGHILQVEDISTFLKKALGIDRFVTLPFEKKLQPWKFHKIALHLFEITRPKIQDQWKIRINFSWSPLGNPLLFYLILEFLHALFSIPLEILCPQLPLFGFFSGIGCNQKYVWFASFYKKLVAGGRIRKYQAFLFFFCWDN